MGDATGTAGLRIFLAQTVLADATADEVSRAFAEQGLESILLKGPALGALLYPEGERTYVDADLLIDPARLEIARTVLADRGFLLMEDQMPPPGVTVHSEPWHRTEDGASVDLHRSLFGCGVSPRVVWPVVRAGAEALPSAGPERRVPSAPVRTLIVALHAAQHGSEASKPMEDLRRAIAQLDDDVWSEAATVAARLDATLTFAAGLSLAPGGSELAARIGVIEPDVAVQALAGAGPLVLGMHRVLTAPRWRDKLTVLGRELLPPPAEMRWRAESRIGRKQSLPVAYGLRIVWLLRNAPSSLRVLRRAYVSRAARSRSGRPGDSVGSAGEGA